VQFLGSVSGSVQEDSGNDDLGNMNLADVPIKLLDASGNVVATTLTRLATILSDLPEDRTL
jgi:hypothetical protein